MITVFLVIIGSSLGGMARYGASGLVSGWCGGAFPVGTIAVNVAGSFVIGLFFGITAESWLAFAAPAWHHLLTFGFLGGVTTFSTLSLETLHLLREGATHRAVLYVSGSVSLGLLAAAIGYALGSA
jgi:fluoride exporter